MNQHFDPRSEAIAAGATVEQFKSNSPSFKFPFLLANEITIDGHPEWLVDGLLPLRGLHAIYGPPGCGKSSLAIDAAMHIATGREWFGREVQQGGVVYLAAEAGVGLRKRIRASIQGHNIKGHVPFAMVSVAPNLGTTKTDHAGKEISDTAKLIAEIEKQAPALGSPIRLIVVDTLARTMFGADENSAADMGAFIANVGRLAEHFDCLAIAVHHNGKNEAAGMRGSSALHGACDAEWEVKALGDTKTVLLVKNKEGEDGLTWSFRLAIETVFDPRNNTEIVSDKRASKPITSCFVEPESLPKHSETAKNRKALKRVKKLLLDAVREALAKRGEAMPQSANLPSGRGVKRSFVKDIAIAKGVGDPEKPNSARAILSRNLISLQADGWIGIHDEWIWLAS